MLIVYRILFFAILFGLVDVQFGFALPEGGALIAGEATITEINAQSLVIGQTTNRAIINWNQFNIAANEQVQFVQPTSYAVALNRIIGGNGSEIMGSLSANGHIFLINPHGIVFGKNAAIDAAGLIATTFDIKNNDFLAGSNAFQINNTGSGFIMNEGKIKVHDGGFVFFIAPSVSNDGFISANGGQVILSARGAADPFSLMVNQSGIIEAKSLVNQGGVIRLIASDPVLNAGKVGAAIHLGEVHGETGRIVQSGRLDVSSAQVGAGASEVTLSGRTVDVSGTILAQGGQGEGGQVLITSSHQTNFTKDALIDTSGVGSGDGGNVVIWSDRHTNFEGTILARGGERRGNGGAIEVSGFEQLHFDGTVNASAPNGLSGSLLLDPKNIVVASGGSNIIPAFGDNAAGTSTISATAITNVTNGGTGVILQASNDIIVNENISIQNPNGNGGALNLQAGRSIQIRANILSVNGHIRLTADQMMLGEGTINAGTGRVTLEPYAQNRDIYFEEGDFSDRLSLSNTELNTITTTGVLQIGNDSVNAISMAAPINTNNVKTMTLIAGLGGISQTAPIIEENLRIQSDGPVTLTNLQNRIGTIAANVTKEGTPFSLTSITTPVRGTVDSVTGITTEGGDVKIISWADLVENASSQFPLSQFRPEGVSVFMDSQGLLSDLRLDILTDRFVMIPKSPCMAKMEEDEEPVSMNGC